MPGKIVERKTRVQKQSPPERPYQVNLKISWPEPLSDSGNNYSLCYMDNDTHVTTDDLWHEIGQYELLGVAETEASSYVKNGIKSDAWQEIK